MSVYILLSIADELNNITNNTTNTTANNKNQNQF